MKKSIIIWISIFCLLLSGCGAALPEKAADDTAWSEDWITLGNIMGVENAEPEGQPNSRSDIGRCARHFQLHGYAVLVGKQSSFAGNSAACRFLRNDDSRVLSAVFYAACTV